MKIKNLLKRAPLSLLILGVLIIFQLHFAYADPAGALQQAKNNLINQIKPIVNLVIVPIADVVMVAILAVKITKAFALYRSGQAVELAGIFILIGGITLITTFAIWGWALIS